MSTARSRVEETGIRLSPSLLRYFAALAAAGAVYPVLAAFVAVEGFSFRDLPLLLPTCLVTSAAACCSGGVVVLGWFAMTKLARFALKPVRYFTIASGLIGLLPVMAIAQAPHLGLHGGYSWSEMVRLFFLGPGTAIPLCQLAGAWSQRSAGNVVLPRQKWRFGIRHILLTTSGIALGLALLKLVGWLTPQIVMWPLIVGSYQWGTMSLVLRLVAWRRWWTGVEKQAVT